jgi:uncharacterized protein YbjT (DUF2867 family)
MKILVIGGTGRIGSKVVQRLRDQGHEAVAAAPQTGVDILSGDGLDAAMQGVSVVLDLSNSPTFDAASVDWFRTAGRNIADAEKKAGVKHHLVMSVVGTDRLAGNDYFRGKLALEQLFRDSGIPYTIIRSTQFFEFLPGIIESSVEGDNVRLSTGLVQPIAADDVAAAVAQYTLSPPANGIVEIAGPERAPMSEMAERYMRTVGDGRRVVGDPHAPYFGGELQADTLVPHGDGWRGTIGFDAWIAQAQAQVAQPPKPSASA